MIFKAEPEMIAALELAGVDVVSTANNHARDQGSHGVEFTLDWLQRHQIAVVGTGSSAEAAHAGVVIERNGMQVRIPGIHLRPVQRESCRYGRPRGGDGCCPRCVRMWPGWRLRADAIIVSMHAGIEYSPKSNAQQMTFARAAIDAGASVVVGHHPHVTQPWERYGQGRNLLFAGQPGVRPVPASGNTARRAGGHRIRGPAAGRASLLPVDIVGTAPRLSRTIQPSGFRRSRGKIISPSPTSSRCAVPAPRPVRRPQSRSTPSSG